MQAHNGPADEAGGAAAAPAAAAAAAPVPAAPAAGNPPAAADLPAGGSQHGLNQDGEAAGEAVDLASLGWPLPLPAGFLQSHRDGGKPGTQQQIQLWAAATLQALQGGPLHLQQLFNRAAPTIGQTPPQVSNYSGSAPHSLARKLLRRFKLVESKQRGHASHLWSLAPGPAVEAAVDKVVRAARAEGHLKPVAAEEGDAAAAAAGGAAAGAAGGASEDRRGSSKRGQGTDAERPSGKRQRRQLQQLVGEQQAGGGGELVGRRLRVFWPDSNVYLGTVIAYDAEEGMHTVHYADGDVVAHDLTAQHYELLEPGQEAGGGASAQPSSSGAAAAATAAAAAQPVAAAAPAGAPAAPPGGSPAAPAAPAGAPAAAAAPAPAPAAPTSSPAAGTSGAGAGGSGGGNLAPQLPPHDDTQVAALLDAAADVRSLMKIAEVLLEVATWAGVTVAQSAEFGYVFMQLHPAARLLRYRMLQEAASQQDAHTVRLLMVGDVAPGGPSG